jgi:hypothetical protein
MATTQPSSGVLVLLEWSFSPADYFEAPISITRGDYEMTISSGKAVATIEAATFDAKPSMRESLHESLRSRFLAVQLLMHRPFELARPTTTRLHPDGRRDISVELEGAQIAVTGGTVDVRITDKDGNPVVDSKRDRIERKKTLGELIAAHRDSDSLLTALLKSYEAGVRDPNNELVHLYEIRDALAARFGGDREARDALGISATVWSRFGVLCNVETVRQGRHRGKSGTALRDATEGELVEARDIARSMIEAYCGALGAGSL